jgi:transposase InsO family protein
MLVQLYSHYSVGYFCKLFGKTRQAFYEQKNNPVHHHLQETLALKLVAEIRKELPRCGTEKLHFMLQATFAEHGIKMGRDALYDLLGRHGFLIRFRRRKPYTTNANHPYRKYPNRIRDLVLLQAGKLWVSDITYLRILNTFAYLSIITDAYSHKIVGYKLHPTLHAQGAIDALLMAAKDPKKTRELIHHSDRGSQYCCADYVREIEGLGIALSMTEKGDPYENAIAERVNGILKQEMELGSVFQNFEAARKAVDEAVRKYNHLRPHDSCSRLTPAKAHEQKGILIKYWKPKKYPQKMTEQTAT